MDCCNYVQPYAGTGHFYQQHHFFYENMNVYGTYGTAPVSSVIESNAFRYNRLPPAYPTDYVYNPKEARLRKAMREQSRELSRQSILQSTIASTSESAAVSDIIVGSSPENFSNHPLTCATPAAAASPLSGSSSINANRIINPWFPVGHAAPTSHLKPILTPRIMAAHQRTIDKTKEVIRKQLECPGNGTFSGVSASNYPRDFATHNTINTTQENNDYCVIPEFAEGQKWHPYQNGTSSYHVRGTPISKISSLHRNVQGSPHRPAHWTQFCGVPLPNSNQNAAIRSPRHVVFLQEQQNQHCNYSEEMQLPYGPSKIDVNHKLHSSYQQEEHQVSNIKKESASSLHMAQLQEETKCAEDGPKWEPSSSSATPVDSPIRSKTILQQEQHERTEACQFPERVDQNQKSTCKQPLPGFHQAFGSTEIGRFSRSEFFASMISDNVSNDGSCLSNSAEIASNCAELPSNCAELPSNCASRLPSIVMDNATSSNISMATYYSDTRSPTPTTPRWHSPYVSAIGSEI